MKIIVGLLLAALLLLSISCKPVRPLENADSPVQSSRQIRCMTYNILYGGEPRLALDWGNGHHTLDKKNRRPLIIELIKQVNPDIIFLQECYGWTINNNKILNDVASALGMHSIIAPTHGPFHLAILSRLPIKSHSWLEHNNTFYWNILYADIELPGGQILKVAGTHYGWWGHPHWWQANDEQKALLYKQQTPVLLAELDKYKNIPFIIAGDFNHQPDAAFYGEQALYSQITAKGYIDVYYNLNGTYENKRTFLHPGDVRDYIFASSAFADKLTRCEIIETPQTYLASDHLPVWADFKLP